DLFPLGFPSHFRWGCELLGIVARRVPRKRIAPTLRCGQQLPEAISPARVAWLPTEHALGLHIRRPARIGHEDNGSLTGHEPAEPSRNSKRWLGADRRGERGEPLRDRSGLIIDDVVYAPWAALNRSSRGLRRIVDVHKGPNTRSRLYDQQAPTTNLFEM